jgi:uncharacterized protein
MYILILLKYMPCIDEIKSIIIPILKKHNVVRSSLFGSFARGENNEYSDIDILIEFGGRKSLFDLIGLQNELEDILKKKVDLITYNSVNPLLKDFIYKDEIKMYG